MLFEEAGSLTARYPVTDSDFPTESVKTQIQTVNGSEYAANLGLGPDLDLVDLVGHSDRGHGYPVRLGSEVLATLILVPLDDSRP